MADDRPQETRRGVLGDRMSIILPVLGVAFAAFCVWLTVRIVNRRERWAKWTLAAVLSLPVLYVASFGPWCWVSSHTNSGTRVVSIVYDPLMKLSVDAYSSEIRTGWFRQPVFVYSQLFSPAGWNWVVDVSDSTGSDEFRWIWVDTSR